MDGNRGLVLAYGNPVRGDDGLGPAAAEYLESMNLEGITVDTDYQLSLEDTLSVANHEFTVFIDACIDGDEPYTFTRVEERNDPAVFSHALDPPRIMGLANNLFCKNRVGYQLAIRGYDFTMFSEGLTDQAQSNMKEALEFITTFLHKEIKSEV